MSVEELPNYENAVRLAREARGERSPTSIAGVSTAGTKLDSPLEPHRASTRRSSRARRHAVLGLCVLLLSVFFFTRVHVHAHHASLVAAADVPAARIREVDAMRSIGAATGALVANSILFAGQNPPDGWMLIADSSTQMTHKQGGNGWSYWYSREGGTELLAMQPSVFVDAGPEFDYVVWSPSPTMGCSTQVTVCHVLRQIELATGETLNNMHGNRVNCCAPAAGHQDPLIRWSAPNAMPARIVLFGKLLNGLDPTITLTVNQVPVFLGDSSSFGVAGATYEFEAADLKDLSMMFAACGNFNFKIRVFTPDCNGNSIADAVEIANQPEFDWNSDGVLDFCQCPGDVVANGIVDGADLAALLSVWGTDGGIYPRADTNSDGFVDAQDLAAVLSGWGACP